MAKKTLTALQRAFAEHYLANGFKGTRAARDAGYSGNDVTLASVAYENLRKPQIRAYIDERMKAMTMSADEALARLTAMGRGDLREFIGLTADQLRAHPEGFLLHKVKQKRRIVPVKDGEPIIEEDNEVELYDAKDAIVILLKEQHLRAGEATEITDDASLTDEDRAARITALLDRARARRDGQVGAGAVDGG